MLSKFTLNLFRYITKCKNSRTYQSIYFMYISIYVFNIFVKLSLKIWHNYFVFDSFINTHLSILTNTLPQDCLVFYV